jgi:ATP-dependent DNA helicase RecG
VAGRAPPPHEHPPIIEPELRDSGLVASLESVVDLIDRQLALAPERLARVRGLDKAVAACLDPIDQALVSSKGRVFLRRLRRSFSDLGLLDGEERVERLDRTREAVLARIRQGDDAAAEERSEPKRAQDAPPRDVACDAAVPVEQLKGVGPAKRDCLATLGIHTVADLLHHLPRRYQDRTTATPIGELQPGHDAVVVGRISGVRSGRGRRTPFVEIAVEDGSGTVLASWFRPPPWVRKSFVRGDEVCLMGAVEKKAPPLRMTHPEFEAADATRTDGVHRGAVVPLYRLPEGMGQRTLRSLLHRAFADFADGMPDRIPGGLRRRLGLPGRAESLRALHFPEGSDDLPALREGRHPAHEALLWEDLFVLQVALARRRGEVDAHGCSVAPTCGRGTLRDRLRARLPFRLTGAQGRVLVELDADLAADRPMQRLLQGDVGSGKTVVALLAAAPLIERGDQVAVLAPTEVLAGQWWQRARELFEPEGHAVALLTGGQKAAARRESRRLTRDGGAKLVVGTHAIFQEGVEFDRLGLAVVDEQHRFGVFQRAELLAKGREPHLLAMTATPIPRSLALTLYGDLDLATIDERPPRGALRTDLWPTARLPDAWSLVREAVERGERAFVVCSRVEGRGDGHAAVETAEDLAAGPLAGLRLGVLHGRMDGDAKNAALDRFRRGDIAVLVGTTVIEVGVDVPEATVLVILDADRFGLAQLHQLRGRVGRSTRGGRCVLVSDRGDETGRLQVLASTDDGFEIAAEDLRLRGPGDLVGARQSGAPAFRLSTTPRFAGLLEEARLAAREVASRTDYEEAAELAPLRVAVAVRLPDSAAVQAG